MLHCLTNIATGFGALRRHPHGVLYLLSNFQTDHMAVQLSNRSHGCTIVQQVTWLYNCPTGHMAVQFSNRSHGCTIFQQVTWLYNFPTGHMAVKLSNRSHGCKIVQQVTWLYNCSTGHMAVQLSNCVFQNCRIYIEAQFVQLCDGRCDD